MDQIMINGVLDKNAVLFKADNIDRCIDDEEFDWVDTTEDTCEFTTPIKIENGDNPYSTFIEIPGEIEINAKKVWDLEPNKNLCKSADVLDGDQDEKKDKASEESLVNLDNGNFSCKYPECKFHHKQKSRVKLHIRSKHLGLRPFLCNQCVYSAKSLNALTWHISGVHEKNELNCKECEFVTYWENSLKTHVEGKHRGNPRKSKFGKFLCSFCTFETNTSYKLNKHVNGKHSGVVHYCEQCNYNTTWRHCLYNHKRTVHAENKDDFRCDKCEFSAKLTKSLNMHNFFVHGPASNEIFQKLEDSTYKCKFCAQTYNKISHLKQHLYNNHMDEYSHEDV